MKWYFIDIHRQLQLQCRYIERKKKRPNNKIHSNQQCKREKKWCSAETNKENRHTNTRRARWVCRNHVSFRYAPHISYVHSTSQARYSFPVVPLCMCVCVRVWVYLHRSFFVLRMRRYTMYKSELQCQRKWMQEQNAQLKGTNKLLYKPMWIK